MSKPEFAQVHVGATTTAIMRGEVTDLTDWDDAELLRGTRRDKGGKFRGRPPKLVPVQMLQELNRRRFQRATDTLAGSLVDGAEALSEIITDAAVDPGTRLKAIELLFDRVLGKASQHVALDVSSGDAPFQRAVADAIVGNIEQARTMFETEEAEREAARDARVIDVPPSPEVQAVRSDKPQRKAKRKR